MAFKTSYSHNRDPRAVARELIVGLGGIQPKFVLFFASPAFDTEALGAALSRELGNVPSIGCTTAGELAAGQMLKNSVVLAALDDELLESAAVALVRDMASEGSLRDALAELAQANGQQLHELDPARYVGLCVHDGMSGREDQLMGALSSLCNVPFVGGSAGDELKFRSTQVFVNGVASSGSSALALLRPRVPFQILKTQSFDVLDATLVVTAADENTRTVHAFDGRPAAEAYAAAIGVSVADLPARFQTHPLGLLAPGGEPFVRSPQQLRGDSVVFYSQIKEGMQLRLLRSRDIVAETARDLSDAVAKLGKCSGVINFHCILRTLELEQRGQTQAYGKLFEPMPMVGFSTYGESYIGHVNQTSTMLLFG